LLAVGSRLTRDACPTKRLRMRYLFSVLSVLALAACASQPPQPATPDPFEVSLQQAEDHTRMDREAYIAAHPSISPEFQDAILHGQVLPGMTKDDVLGIQDGHPPPLECPSSRSTTGEVWDYCVHSTRIGPLVTPEMHETIVFDQKGDVVSVAKSGTGPIRSAVTGAPSNYQWPSAPNE
jgi:hypothetical protein